MNRALWFKAIKEQMKDRYEKSWDIKHEQREFWDWMAEEFPDTYALCLKLTNNTLTIREYI
jgi:hypothetical protein